MADFSPEKFISDGNRLKSGLPIRYSVYTHVRDLNLPTFHLKILFQTENFSNLDPIRYSVYTHVRDLNWPTFHLKKFFQTENVSNLDSPSYDVTYILSSPRFKLAHFSPEIFISDGKRLKSGLHIRYNLYTHVRDINLPTFHLKILFQTENFSNLDSPYDIAYILMSEI